MSVLQTDAAMSQVTGVDRLLTQMEVIGVTNMKLVSKGAEGSFLFRRLYADQISENKIVSRFGVDTNVTSNFNIWY